MGKNAEANIRAQRQREQAGKMQHVNAKIKKLAWDKSPVGDLHVYILAVFAIWKNYIS
ncbi:MAG: hypothetical protein OXC66_15065 [Roseovarius sp.]|nr:hypothetical protein [Roseovarius sp.]